MRIGLAAYGLSGPELVRLTVAADAAGFEEVWVGEHVVLPVGYASDHPTKGTVSHQQHTRPIIDPGTELVDPLVALAACAASTTSIRLATGMYLGALRPPLVTARMAYTLHQLSGGRFVMGLGAGWLVEEFTAIGVSFEGRWRRLEETLEILRRAWAGGPFSYRGSCFAFDSVQICRDPIDVPVILGGNSPTALKRAARLGDGWFSSGTPSLDDSCRYRDGLLAEREAAGRTDPFDICVRLAGSEATSIEAYAAEGFDHVVIWADQAWAESVEPDERPAHLRSVAERLGVSPRGSGRSSGRDRLDP